MNAGAFWMICRQPTHPAAKTEPKARYSTREAALDHARALAAQTDATFVVLAVCDVVRPSDANTADLFGS